MRVLLFILCFSGSAFGFADEINEIMNDAGDTMLRMLPSLYDREVDRTTLMENLIRLDYLFKLARPHLVEKQAGSQVTYQIMQRSIRDAIDLGDRRNIDLLRRAIMDSFALCSSCHTQDRRGKRAFGVSKIRALDEYLAGEFSYLTRDYESALTSFDNYFKDGARTAQRDSAALDKILVITAEVYADPGLAAKTLSTYGALLDPGSITSRRVRDWVAVLTRLAGTDGLQSPLGHETVDSLDRFLAREWPAIRSTLNWHEQEAFWVVIRSELNKHMTREPPTADVPRLLYWLAVSDRALHYRFYNSLSRGYLERCIEGYPEHPYAAQCLAEYEMLVLVSFSGSGGTRVPFEVRQRVDELRKTLQKSGNQPDPPAR